MKKSREFLTNWAGDRFDKMAKRISELRRARSALIDHPNANNLESNLHTLDCKIEKLINIEEVHWKSRPLNHWLAVGDRNTEAFHAYANERKQKNEIVELHDNEGKVWRDEGNKARIICDFFKKLYTSEQPNEDQFRPIINSIHHGISERTKAALDEPFIAMDVKNAVFNLIPQKLLDLMASPGNSSQHFC